MGASLTESLQQLRERIDSANLQSFVRAVVQGERLGRRRRSDCCRRSCS